MIKIYMPWHIANVLEWHSYHSVIVDWEPPRVPWRYEHQLKKSDWIVCVINLANFEHQVDWIKKRKRPGQRVVFINVYTSDEKLGSLWDSREFISDPLWFQEQAGDICFVDCNKCILNKYPDVVYYDFLWERQKVYFTEYSNYDLSNKIHTRYSTREMFQLVDIDKRPDAKHFLAPMRVWNTWPQGRWFNYEARSLYRKRLRQILDPDLGWVSDHHNGVFIRPQEDAGYIKRDLENAGGWFAGGSWYPAHNDYYNSSFVSVYVETITFGNSYRVVTEKTWDPMIKGNFILPFGYCGLVQDILDYGFVLPDWLDYSYDSVADDSLRFSQYLDSVRRLLAIPQQKLYALYQQDMWMLQNNRSLFYSEPRVSLLESIHQNFSTRGCQTTDPSSNGQDTALSRLE